MCGPSRLCFVLGRFGRADGIRSKRRSRSLSNQPDRTRAAEYVRMSTDHQQYSTENQHAAIQRFADAHGITIVRSFRDAGKSGVGIQGREALQDLLRMVESGQAEFTTILVYDVSRWGRFQEADEGAYYEFRCEGPTSESSIAPNNFPQTTRQCRRHEKPQARHGRRIQPRVERESFRRPMPPHYAGLSTRRHSRLGLRRLNSWINMENQKRSSHAVSGRASSLSG